MEQAASDFNSALRERLRELRSASGLSQAAMAKRLGLERDTYAKYENRSPLPHELLPKASAILGVSLGFLLTGRDNGAPPSVHQTVEPRVIEEGDELYTLLPVYDVRAAAGAGAFVDAEEILYHQPMRSEFLRRVTSAPASMLALVEVDGDSMWPTLHSGDHALIDRSVNRYARDGIYALDLGDGLQVKRIAMHPTTKRLTVKSDNPEYPTYDGIDPAELRIVGRVLWIGRRV